MDEHQLRSRLWILSAIILVCVSAGCGKPGYGKVKGKWAWIGWNEAVGRHETFIEADLQQFKILKDRQYGKDQSHVFYRGSIIQDADPATFDILPSQAGPSGQCYSRDQSRVYLEGHRITHADPASFEVIDPPYARDKNRVYCGTVPMQESDPKTFQILIKTSSWSTMTNKEFFLEMQGGGIDDFEVSEKYPAITSNGCWSKDARSHYRDAARIVGADYETFRAIDGSESADKHRRYMFGLTKDEYDQRVAERRQQFQNRRADR
ncbi:MAG TPA: DKNYY domain-containing protein [Planctomycetaceae bacterium]|nr:DKNYY domain-containing protein [Planctomycetaceae bacterium]